MNKCKLTALSLAMASVLAAPAVNAADEFKLPKGLSIGGFIDMSSVYTDVDGGDSESSSGLDQVELNIAYDFGNKLSAAVDLEHQDGDSGTDIEQAFITYALTDDFSFKAGRFLSYTGWETEEPTGLFQYSGTGYAPYFYGYYQQGVSGLYSGDMFSAAVSVVNTLAGPEDTDSEQVGVETMLAVTPMENLTIKAFYSVEGDTTLINSWASYVMGDLTLAVEVNSSEYDDDSEGEGYLAMANYSFGDAAVTLRYHDYEIEDAAGVEIDDGSAITISPSYAVNDNLLIVTEYRMDESDINGDSDTFAIEALVTF